MLCDPHKPCVACGLAEMQTQREHWLSLPEGGFVHEGVDFHVNDFVYIHNSRDGGLLVIGQIVEFCCRKPGQVHEIQVLCYGRYDHVVKKQDNPLLYLDNVSG